MRKHTGAYRLVPAVLPLVGILLVGCDRGRDRTEVDLSERISTTELQKRTPDGDSGVLRFGFDLRNTPEEDARQYLPLLDYLSKATGYRFELSFMPDSMKALTALGRNEIQFAALGAGSYIIAHDRFGAVPVVRGIDDTGRAEYRSVIVVLPDSPIQRIEDLAGKRFAFGSETSTQGHLIPRIALTQHHVTVGKLSLYDYTGSHHSCANAVLAGRFDAGGIQDTMGMELAEAGLVRIIHTSTYYPSSGIAANRDVSPHTLARVRQALLDFDPQVRDAADLYHWDKTEMIGGFTEADDADYTELREWSEKFGFLGERGEDETR